MEQNFWHLFPHISRCMNFARVVASNILMASSISSS
ncbi:hypothetical protein CIPAW_06G090900 [Carya illinoinensis]|uniref:Uncharacterized protein n=1 Tax=Carya illinoinensis TaxID=32201 RepID=A0A8T1Q9X6_CARIL|nr:hypothetical protein CIPAW_06G090900 [Carya illinoinensis]